jgi:ABC-type nitrate/sulfonate/bicarbonate transport system substrate-binding protein
VRTGRLALRKKLWPAVVLISACALAAACGSGSGSGGGTGTDASASGSCSSYQTVTYGAIGGLTDAGLIIGQDENIFRKYCINIVLQRVSSASALTTALASNAIQVGGIAESPGMFTSIKQGITVSIVADKDSSTSTMSFNQVIVQKKYVRSTVKATLEALKGTTIALPSTTDNTLFQVEKFLALYGLNISMYHVSIVPIPDTASALETNQAQWTQINEPSATEMVVNGCCQDLANIDAFMPAQEPPTLIPLVYGPYLLEKANQATAQNFMDAFLAAARVYDNAVLKGDGVSTVEGLLAKSAWVNEPLSIVKQMDYGYIDPNGLSLAGSQQNTIAWLTELENYYISAKLMPSSDYVNPASMLDLTFAKQAVKTLGAYPEG